MENCLSCHSQTYSKFYFLYGLIFVINLGALVVLSINYCKSTYSLELLEENDPDIDLTGLKSFSFSTYSNMEYYPEMSNLGNTGKLYFDCFAGKCKYKEAYTCNKEICTGTENNKQCNTFKTTCYRYYTENEYSCSTSCRRNKSSSCHSSFCHSYTYDSYYYSSSCSRNTDTESIDTVYQSCNADNLVLFWNNFYYKRVNNTDYKTYSYLNSAVTANESCPAGKKVCGILDNLGNKLCYPEFINCPLNYITLNTSNLNYTFNQATIGNKTIYFTNEAVENGKIVGGLFVDSDLLIKYNNEDCQILDESSVMNLLNGHYNRLYRNTLSYDPYTSNKIEVQQGKSYLKWCVPGVGKEKNISKIKELNAIYLYNITTNRDVINPIKNMSTASFFVSLPGFIGMFFLLIVLLFSFFAQNKFYEVGRFLGCKSAANLIFLICICVSDILLIVSSILMIVNNGNLGNATKLDLNIKVLKSIKLMNFVGLGICAGLVILIFVFVLYLFIAQNTYIESPKPDTSYHPYKDTYSNNAGAKNGDFKASNNLNNNMLTSTNSTNTNKDNNYNSSNDFNNYPNTGNNPNTNANGYNSSNF